MREKFSTKSAWNKYGKNDLIELEDLCTSYKKFLSDCKTERECVAYFIDVANKNNFKDLKQIIENGEKLKNGDKVYYSKMDKTLILAIIGEEDLEKGLIKEINDINRIDLENIHYTYNGKDEVLKNVNLTLMKGERILIYGLSGSGKSTLARLLTGVLNTAQGKIKINDIELINYSLDCLRNNICYVSQNEQLFTASIYENVCLTDNGDTETSSNQFLKVCQLCKVDEIAAKSPLAYQLPLEENGFNISGGERQRIILARALLKNAKCYIFDESMNEIDIHREREILKALFQEYPNKIFIMISHRYHNSDLFYQKYQLINGEFYVKRAQYDTSR